MTVALRRIAPLAFRWQAPRVASGVGREGFVCWHCKKQKQRRNFHQTSIRREKGDSKIDGEQGDKSHSNISELLSEEMQGLGVNINDDQAMKLRSEYHALSPDKQKSFRANFSQRVFEDLQKHLPEDIQKEVQQLTKEHARQGSKELAQLRTEMQRDVGRSIAAYEKDKPFMQRDKKRRSTKSFWDLGEESTAMSLGNTDNYQGDDLNELGHEELERHRELRHYARIAVWEMPLLSKLAKPFQPPDATEMLRFRYTTYMGEEHPAAKKMVLEFDPSDLPDLTEAQRNKLIKLVGPRYNPETQIVKMSSDLFETQAQNKRYLSDLVDTLTAEAKDDTDTFEDVPFDFRHHKFKKRIEFPQDWALTSERKKLLELERGAVKASEQQRMLAGDIVDGTKIHELAMASIPVKGTGTLLEQQRGGKRGRPMPRMLR